MMHAACHTVARHKLKECFDWLSIFEMFLLLAVDNTILIGSFPAITSGRGREDLIRATSVWSSLGRETIIYARAWSGQNNKGTRKLLKSRKRQICRAKDFEEREEGSGANSWN
jgi:hypothetical protein